MLNDKMLSINPLYSLVLYHFIHFHNNSPESILYISLFYEIVHFTHQFILSLRSRAGLFSDEEDIDEIRHKRVLSCRPLVTSLNSAKPGRSGRGTCNT